MQTKWESVGKQDMTAGRRRAVFLDRDGVLNDVVVRDGKPYPPASVAELAVPAAVPALVQRLKDAGFVTVCVTNQPDVARGRQTRAVADALNDAVGRYCGARRASGLLSRR